MVFYKFITSISFKFVKSLLKERESSQKGFKTFIASVREEFYLFTTSNTLYIIYHKSISLSLLKVNLFSIKKRINSES